MLTLQDFSKKQIVFVFAGKGEKLSFSNENLVVKDKDDKIKLQCTCYRVYIVYIVGDCSITTPLIKNSKKYGFYISLMTQGFRNYYVIGAKKDGNTILKRRQYEYKGTDIAKYIVENKINNQISVLQRVRVKSDSQKDAVKIMSEYLLKIKECSNLNEIMAYEGLSSKIYFRNHFNNITWNGRQPRLKRDSVNSVLDIGYTLLFSFVDTLLESFGFDTYCGFMHTQFYMRKSLVCDFVEPFRPIVDSAVKKAYNLKQIKEDDFLISGGQHLLKWEKSAEYTAFLLKAIIEHKEEIFVYIRDFYRAFLKNADISKYPFFEY